MNGKNLPLSQSLRTAPWACLLSWLLFRLCLWPIFQLMQGCRRARVYAVYRACHFHSRRCTETWIRRPHSSQGEPQGWISFRVFSTPYCQCGWTGGQLRAWMKARVLVYFSALGLSSSWGCGSTCGETLSMSGLQQRLEDVIQTHIMKK